MLTRHPPTPAFNKALANATAFAAVVPFKSEKALRTGYLERGLFQVTDLAQTLVWSDAIELFEFRLEAEDGTRAYVVTSAADELPPVLEYGFSRDTLTEAIWKGLKKNFPQLSVPSGEVRFIYASALEVIIEISSTDDGRERDIYWNYWTEPVKAPGAMSISRRGNFPAVSVRSQVASLHRVGSRPISASTTLVRRPVRFNQNFDRYDDWQRAESACVSGCSPVAWAMLESAYAKGARETSGPYLRIYAGVDDWDAEWPSYVEPDPSRSSAVTARIWDFHRVMNTGCNGGTHWSTRYVDGRCSH